MVKMEIIEFIIIPLKDEELIRNENIKRLCRVPYHGHKRGCPNSLGYGKSCKEEYIDDMIQEPYWFVCAVCDFKGYKEKMLKLHKHWSDRQLANSRYWQGNIKKRLREYTEQLIVDLSISATYSDLVYDDVPEGYGVNVIKTIENKGYSIPRRPIDFVWKVFMIYRSREQVECDTGI